MHNTRVGLRSRALNALHSDFNDSAVQGNNNHVENGHLLSLRVIDDPLYSKVDGHLGAIAGKVTLIALRSDGENCISLVLLHSA